MKTLLVYGHLIAACIAIGAIFLQDLEIWSNRHKPLSKAGFEGLQQAQTIITWTLILLWITGIALVIQGYMLKPDVYLSNEKLWVKVVVVVTLTINGFLLHFYTLPKLQRNTVLIDLAGKDSVPLTLTGCVSAVSWLYACFLGIARPWNYTLEFSVILGVYVLALVVASIVGLSMMRMARNAVRPVLPPLGS